MPLFSAEEGAGRSSIHLSVWRRFKWGFLSIVLVEVASGSGDGRRRLSGSDCGSRDSRQDVNWGCCGFVYGNLVMRLFEILFEDLDLILHSIYQKLHFRVGLFFEDLFYPPSSGNDLLHCSIPQFLYLSSERPLQCPQKGIDSVSLGGFLVLKM